MIEVCTCQKYDDQFGYDKASIRMIQAAFLTYCLKVTDGIINAPPPARGSIFYKLSVYPCDEESGITVSQMYMLPQDLPDPVARSCFSPLVAVVMACKMSPSTVRSEQKVKERWARAHLG